MKKTNKVLKLKKKGQIILNMMMRNLKVKTFIIYITNKKSLYNNLN